MKDLSNEQLLILWVESSSYGIISPMILFEAQKRGLMGFINCLPADKELKLLQIKSYTSNKNGK